MKKLTVGFFSFAFVLSMATLSHAGDLPKPVHKLAAGVVDVVTSPIEIYDHAKGAVEHSDRKVLGLFKGLIESPLYMVKKAGHGVVDAVTFLIE